MIAGPYDVLPVRQTATTSGNASRRHVGRTSVAGGLICLALGFASVAGAADTKKIRRSGSSPVHGRISHRCRKCRGCRNTKSRGPLLLPRRDPVGRRAKFRRCRSSPFRPRPSPPRRSIKNISSGWITHHSGPVARVRCQRRPVPPDLPLDPLRPRGLRDGIRCIGRTSPCRCSSIASRRLRS